MLLNETNKLSGLNTIIELVGSGVVKYSDLIARLRLEKAANRRHPSQGLANQAHPTCGLSDVLRGSALRPLGA